jgi:Abi-like protein
VTRTFGKPALTIAQQLAHLQTEGMAVADPARAEHWLRHVSYYRLSAYWLPFEHPKGHGGPRFLPGTTFETISALYEFDRHLRLHLLSAIERIEVAIRGAGPTRSPITVGHTATSTRLSTATAANSTKTSRASRARLGPRPKPISPTTATPMTIPRCRRFGWWRR